MACVACGKPMKRSAKKCRRCGAPAPLSAAGVLLSVVRIVGALIMLVGVLLVVVTSVTGLAGPWFGLGLGAAVLGLLMVLVKRVA